MGKKVVSKEDVIKEYKSLLNNFLSTTGSNKITRKYYREHSEFPYLYEKYFSSFDELKKAVDFAHKLGKKVVYHAHSTEEDFRNSFIFSKQGKYYV